MSRFDPRSWRDFFDDAAGPSERRWRGIDDLDDRHKPPRALLAALVLASLTVMTLDHQSVGIDAVRSAVGEVIGPVEGVAADAVRPFTSVPTWLRSKDDLREQVAELTAENKALKDQVRRGGFDRNRLGEYDALTASARSLGRSLVPARVIAYGPGQSFQRTVTIDAGSAAGIRPDQTVLNNDGLIGRVLRTSRTTATVLLILDAKSVVGGRIGENMEIGALHGRGDLGSDGRLDLELVDHAEVPAQGDNVVSWGSDGGGPYVQGVPIGTVEEVFSSLREQSQRAVIVPFADFSALDVVGVVVPEGVESDRGVIRADGSLR